VIEQYFLGYFGVLFEMLPKKVRPYGRYVMNRLLSRIFIKEKLAELITALDTLENIPKFAEVILRSIVP